MLHKIAERITLFYIKKNKLEQSEKETYDYCFEVLLSTAINLIAIIVMAAITKLYLEALCFTIFFMLLRGSSGGYHAKTHLGCFLELVLVYSILPISYRFISMNILRYVSIGSLILGCIIIFLLAPVDNANNPLNMDTKRRLRIKSITIVSLTLIICCILIAFQSTTRYAYVISYVALITALTLCTGIMKNKLCDKKVDCKIISTINADDHIVDN